VLSVKRAVLATASIAVIVFATAAVAQTETTPPPPSNAAPPPPAKSKAKDQSTGVSELVITGSRIKTSEFTSASPVTVLTPEQAQLEGKADIAELLQSLPVAENNTQINNFFTGFVVTGGPGVNTLSLRGLGAQRTLFLVNGQRLGPAGVGGTVGPVDLNTLNFPQAEIEDIQILTDGASSIYGSDAIGGVVNIITKTNYNGGDIRVYYGPSQEGGANQYQVDASFGKTWSRGYVNAGFSWYKQNALTVGQRPYLSCASDDAVFTGTNQVADVIDPSTNKPKCWNLEGPDVIDFGYGPALFYRPNASSVPGGGVTGLDIAGWQAVGQVVCNNPAILYSFNNNSCGTAGVNVPASRTNFGIFPYNTPTYGSSDAISPDERYMFNLYGGFDLTPHAQLYGSIILTERRSSQFSVSQLFTPVYPTNPYNPGFGFPEPVIPQNSLSTQKVDYGRITLGVKGDFPDWNIFKKWTYDLYGEFSQSHGYYTENFALADRVNATAGALDGTGCDVNGNINGGPTMAELEPGVPCSVPVNYFAGVQNGALTPAEQSFLYRNETGWTIYNHYYVEGSASGDLWNLPGGPLAASLGFQLRREEIDDNPPTDVQDGNDYNLLTVGRTHGSDTIEEVFGELRAPIVKDLPLIDSLVFTASGRFSNYKSYGSTVTYKIGLDWALTDWFSVRATQGTGFRAPALYELFLADQSSYLGQLSIDPCINYSISGVSANVQKNCASQGIPGNYAGNGGSAEILTGGGIGHLKAETSLSQTIGVVFQPKWFGINLKISADYYSFDIKNQIQEFGAANILYECYNAPNFPANPFCSLFTRDLTPGSPNYQSITLVEDNYVNVAEQRDQGLDVIINYTQALPWDVKMSVDSRLSWTFYTTTDLLNGAVNNYLGQVGQPTFVGNLNFRFDKGPWTFNWFINMIGHSDDNKFVADVDNNYFGFGQSVYLNHVAPFYTVSNVSIRRKLNTWTFEAGMNNVFNTSPPLYSSEGFQDRIGQVPLTSQYDLIGRVFFVDIEKKF